MKLIKTRAKKKKKKKYTLKPKWSYLMPKKKWKKAVLLYTIIS